MPLDEEFRIFEAGEVDRSESIFGSGEVKEVAAVVVVLEEVSAVVAME